MKLGLRQLRHRLVTYFPARSSVAMDVNLEQQHEGWLFKMGHAFNTDFKRRYFVLRGSRLAYFEDPGAASKGKSKGEVTVTRVRHLRRGEGGSSIDLMRVPLSFHFDTAENKPFIVYAEAMRDKIGWLKVLLAATRRARSMGASAKATTATTATAVEDLYREQVAACEADSASLPEPAAWKAVASGVAHVRQQKLQEALAAYGMALELVGHGKRVSKEPVALAALYETGKLFCEALDYSAAITHFELVLGVAPPEVANVVRLQCAWCHWQQQDVAKAESLYAQVLEDDPLQWQAMTDRARMQLQQAKWADALPDLELLVGESAPSSCCLCAASVLPSPLTCAALQPSRLNPLLRPCT